MLVKMSLRLLFVVANLSNNYARLRTAVSRSLAFRLRLVFRSQLWAIHDEGHIVETDFGLEVSSLFSSSIFFCTIVTL